MFMVQNVCPLVNLILGGLSSEFHSTSSTSESEQKTKIMETGKLEGEKEIKKTFIKLYGKLLWTVITIMLEMFEELSQCNDVASIN